MTVGVGVIGTGMIGQDHIRRITSVLAGGAVVAVNDVDAARAGQVAAGLPAAVVHASAGDLIADPGVDAVLVASWGPAHEEAVLAAIAAGKPVFCEKPLAPDPRACLRIMDAELTRGRRLLQVGFMRRYDAGYQALKATVADGRIGAPLLMHCAHRNPSVPPYGFTTEMIISDSAVHEMDVVRWLFEAEIVSTQVLTPRRSRRGGPDLQDPLIVLFELANGVLVDDEVFVNAGYGYDVRGEIVGETGTAAMAGRGELTVTTADQAAIPDGQPAQPASQSAAPHAAFQSAAPQAAPQTAPHSRVPADWQERFAQAYDAELQDWLRAVEDGTAAGPGAWDGYAAAAVTESALTALHTGQRTPVSLISQPDFYAKAG